MTDTITLPREVVQEALEALDSEHPDIQLRAAIALRIALAAEPTKPEPVAWMDRFGFVFRGKGPHETFTTPLYTAPPDAEALRRDAERYRYLRNRDPAEVLSKEGKDAGCWIDCEEKGGIAYKLQLLTGDDADAAIDAAMKEGT